MQQRLAIARALLTDPALLLLDEPFDGLDSEGTEMLLHLLRSGRERSILMATHRHSLAEDLADRALFLRQGLVAGELSLADHAPGALAARQAELTEAP